MAEIGTSKHQIMKEYLEEIAMEAASGTVTFNFSDESPDSMAILTNYSDRVIRRFITGECEKEYGFAIVITKQYSSETDDINLEAMDFAQAVVERLHEKDRLKDYPDFGEDCEVLSIEPLQNMPNLAAVNAKEQLARYQVQGRVRYREPE